MQKKISQLPSTSNPTDAMVFPTVQGGTTKKVSMASIKEYLLTDNIQTKSGSLVSSGTISSGQEYGVGSFTFLPMWGVAVVDVTFGAGSAGYRRLWGDVKKSGGVTSYTEQITVAPSPSGVTRLQLFIPLLGESTVTGVEVMAMQTSGNSIAITASYRLVGFLTGD